MIGRLTLSLVFVSCVSLATVLAPRFEELQKDRNNATSAMALIMGDSRQIFATYFYTKADDYFHEGAYISVFDRSAKGEGAHSDHADHVDQAEDSEEQHKAAANKKGRDWIESFGRHFLVTEHKHLESTDSREILPWLKLSAEMDPHSIEPYVTAAYWLRKRMDKPDEAERFLRDGLRANPDSYEILFELGIILEDCKNDSVAARRLWELGLQKWDAQKQAGKKPDELTKIELLGRLVKLAEKQGDIPLQIRRLEELKTISPSPDDVEILIQEARLKLSSNGAVKP